MAQPLSATCTRDSVAPAAAGKPSGLMVMALRAAEQHVLVVLGEADLHTAGQLRAELIDRLPVQPPSVVVELGALEFCDLSGLDALHAAARAAHEVGVTLSFRGMSPLLAWLHHRFPPPPLPPRPERVRSGPGLAIGVLPSPQTSPAPPAPPSTPTTSASARRTPADRPLPVAPTSGRAGPGQGPDLSRPYQTGYGGRRRGAPDGFVHAVPTQDATRSAMCGARVWAAAGSWTGAAPASCPECLLEVARESLADVRVCCAPQAASARPRTQQHP